MASKSSSKSSSSSKKLKTSFTNSKGQKVKVYTDGSKTYSGGSSSSKSSGSSSSSGSSVSSSKTVDNNYFLKEGESTSDYNKRIAEYNASKNAPETITAPKPTSGPSNVDENYFLKPGESTDAYNKRIAEYNASKGAIPAPVPKPTDLTTESITEAVKGGMGTQEQPYVPKETETEVTDIQQPDQNVLPVPQGQQVGGGSVGGQTSASVPQASNPSIVDYLSATGQPSDFNSRAALAKQLGISGYTGSALQNQQMLASLRGVPVSIDEKITPISPGAITQTSNVAPVATQTSYEALSSKFGLQQTQDDFFSDPIKTIKDITKQVFSAMGLDQANSEIKNISKELEKLENDKDEEIRAINDDPWITEGVRLRQLQKVEEKWEDKINNRVNRLQLLENVRDDAQQQAQFALGTAISIFDSERKFQAAQQQMYHDQAQREFDNAYKMYQMSQPASSDATSEMKEYMLSVEQGFNGSFLDYKQAIAAAGRAPSGGDGYTGPYTKAQLSAISKINEAVSKNAVYVKTVSMRGYIDNVNAALAQANGLSDIAAINQFQKVIDEGAVTRDQDVVLIQGAQSLANSLRTRIAGLEKGDKLGVQQRTQMQNLMSQIYNAQVRALGKDPYIAAKKTEAGLYGLTESDTILGELGGFGGQQQQYGPVQPQEVFQSVVSQKPASTGIGGFFSNFLSGLFAR